MSTRGRPRSFDRDAALHRAMEVFWTKGYDNASLADLTAAMGIAPPSLYAAFGSKDGLFRAAVTHYVETEGGGIWEGVEAAPTARAAVEHVLRASAEAFGRGPVSRGCMIVLAAPQMEGASAEACAELQRFRLENIAILERRLQRAVREGELPPSTDCKAIASYYATLQHGLSITARDGADRATLLGIADRAMAGWDVVVKG